MAGWTTHTGQAVVLDLNNVDTDQLIPARFMSVPRAQGYGDYLLHDMRRDAEGGMDPRFALNTTPDASVLIAGQNFGSGSSREAAVYALVDAGFRAVIAPSFGDIFASNAVNNGLLPARVDAEVWTRLTQHLSQGTTPIQVDIAQRHITIQDTAFDFALQSSWQDKLVNGWDDIDLTHHHRSTIAAFQDTYHRTAAWAWPARTA